MLKFARSGRLPLSLGLWLLVCVCFAQTGAGEPVISFHQSGGFAGVNRQWQIYADGRVVDGGGKTTRADVQAVERLRASIRDSGFFEFAGSYMPKQPMCCDHYSYVITVRDGERSHTVATLSQAPAAPAELFEIITSIQNLLAGVDK
jgi:hypothetical protein